MAIDKLELIRKYIKSRVGAPVIDLCEPELSATDEAVEAAATRYWTALPYQTTDQIPMSLSCSEVTKSISSIKDNAFGTSEIKEDAYFLGIGRYEDSGLYNTNYSGSNHFDQRLLGRSFGSNFDNQLTEDPRYTADRVLLNSSQSDLFFGEPDFRHDIINDEMSFILPAVEGTLHCWYNWGFCPSKTIEVLPMVHFDLFKRMVAFEYLEILLAARSGLTLSNADYQLDVTDLTNKRDSLKEEIKEELSNIAIIPGVWG